MQKEVRTVCYDDDLQLEAYRFEGIAQPFPNHFHDYYVIGFIEAGTRCLIPAIITVVCNVTAERLITEV